jgi:hypothetical protein
MVTRMEKARYRILPGNQPTEEFNEKIVLRCYGSVGLGSIHDANTSATIFPNCHDRGAASTPAVSTGLPLNSGGSL